MQQYNILLGRDARSGFIKLPGDEHVALHARSGSGKSSSFTIPNCFTWPGSLVVLDIKAEAFHATAGYRANVLKQDVYRLDLASPEGRSHKWDPLARVDRTSVDRFDQIFRIGSRLFQDTHSTDGGNAAQFWVPAARMAFNAVTSLIAETPEEPLKMANILRQFTMSGGSERLKRRIIEASAKKQPYSRIVADGVGDYVTGDDPRQSDGIRKTVSTRLQAWFNPRVAAATSESDFDLGEIRRKPMTIYITVSPGDLPRMSSVIQLFFDELINLNTTATPQQDPSLKWQTLILLDEFSRIGKIESVAHAVQFARGYGIRLAFVVQNKAQVKEVYGNYATADIFGNLGSEVVFGAGDLETAKELESRLGDDTVNVTTLQRPRFWSWARPSRQSNSDHPHRRPLLLAQEVIAMPPHQEIILRPGMKPILAQKIRWWQEPAFTELVCSPPKIPELKVEVPLDDGVGQVPRRTAKAMAGVVPV